MSLREAASDDEDDLQSVSDGKSVFSDSDEEDQGTLAARAAPRSQASTDSDQPTTTAYPATPHPNAGVGPTQQDSSESEAGSLESAEVVEERAEVEAKGTRPPRKPLQPFDVPTSGAFYMHDDRNGSEEEAPRQRASRRKVFEDTGPDKWTHDLFETLDRPPSEDKYRGFLASKGTRRRDGSRGPSNAEIEGSSQPRRGRRGTPVQNGKPRSQETAVHEEPEKPPGYEVPLGVNRFGNGRPRGGQSTRGARAGRQGGGDRSQGGRHTQQNGSVQKTGGSKGGAAVPESVDEWPALPSLPVNNHLKPAVAAATQHPGTEANGWDEMDDDIEYAPALPEAAIGDMDPFSVKPVARPLTIQAPDGDAGQSGRSRQSTRGRGRRFMSPPGRA